MMEGYIKLLQTGYKLDIYKLRVYIFMNFDFFRLYKSDELKTFINMGHDRTKRKSHRQGNIFYSYSIAQIKLRTSHGL